MSGVQKPAFEILVALAKLARYIRRPYIIVSQAKLIERVRATTGRKMSRRTLNRHLAELERRQYINRTQRHLRDRRTGRTTWRATLFTFAHFGILWIRDIRDAAAIPLGRPRVPFPAHSRKPSLFRRITPVGKASTGERRSSAPKGRRNGPEKRAAR